MKLKRATAKIVLAKHKVSKKTGEYPIKLRVTFEGRSQYFSLGIKTTIENWDETTSRILRDKERKNFLINQKDTIAQNILLDFEREGTPFGFRVFENRFGISQVSRNVLDEIKLKIQELEEENRLGTASNYKDCMYRLEDFKGGPGIAKQRAKYSLALANGKEATPYKQPKISFQDIDVRFLEEFQKYLSKKRGNSKSTIGFYMRPLRAIIKNAIKKGLIFENNDPFKKGFKIQSAKPSKIKSLTHDQMMAIKSFQADDSVRKNLDLFVLSYYLDGSNLTDIAQLQWSNISNGRISFNRAKTGKILDIEISENVAEIITRYSNNNSNYVFPILSDDLTPKQIRDRVHGKLKKINATLKSIASAVGIPEDVTFYWARHSFAARLYNMGVSVSTISEMMTHSDMRTTKNYIGRLDKSHLDDVRKNL